MQPRCPNYQCSTLLLSYDIIKTLTGISVAALHFHLELGNIIYVRVLGRLVHVFCRVKSTLTTYIIIK